LTTVRLAGLHFPVTSLGPGRRLGLWLPGCHIGCPGCLSRDTWDPEAVDETEVSEVLEAARSLVDVDMSGVTISGGEPFEQPDALLELLDGLHSEFGSWEPEVDFLCYSGFPERHLRSRFPEILRRLDVLIPGPYREGTPAREPWRGSGNQPTVLLSPLGAARFGSPDPDSASVQILVADGRLEIIGTPRASDMREIEERLTQVGVVLRGVSWRP